MKSRAKVFGGKMHVVSAPGEGCIVTITLPSMVCEETGVNA
jgi:signal transduction histidine kinase